MNLRVVLALASLLSSLWLGYSQGSSRVQAKFDQYKALSESNNALVAEQNAQAQARVATSFQQTLERRQSEVQNLTAQRDALLVSLRNRPSRQEPSVTSRTSEGNSTTSPTTVTACGPEQLYREDAEFLARFAADAEAVRQELLGTRDAYENVKETVGQ